MLNSDLGTRYIADMDRMFDSYSSLIPQLTEFFRESIPKDPNDSDFAYRSAIKARALDAIRGMLPAASLSNVGIYGTGQAYEALLLRMRAHPLPEARAYADLMLTELRKVVPSFLKRVDLPDRGVRTSAYMADIRDSMEALTDSIFGDEVGRVDDDIVDLVDFDPDGEVKLVTAYALPPLVAVRAGGRSPGPPDERRGPHRGDRGVRGESSEPPASARTSVRTHRLSIRCPVGLRGVPRSPAPSHADHRLAATLAPPWLCAARSGGSSRCDRRVRCGDGSIRRAA